MHFGQILVKIFFQTRKLKNSTSFEPIFLNPKNPNSKHFGILKPEKLKPEPQLNMNSKKSKLDYSTEYIFWFQQNEVKINHFKAKVFYFCNFHMEHPVNRVGASFNRLKAPFS